MRSDIENITSFEELDQHLEYMEILIEMFHKRGLDYSELTAELQILELKKLDLVNIKKQ